MVDLNWGLLQQIQSQPGSTPGINASQPQAGQAGGMQGGSMPGNSGIASAMPKATPAPTPSSGGGGGGSGGGLGGILGMFGGLGKGGSSGSSLGGLLGLGSNPVSTANAALNSQMQNMHPQQLANMISPSSVVQQQMQGKPQAAPNMNPSLQTPSANQIQGSGANTFSPQMMGQYASKTFPGDPVRQQLAVAQATEESRLLGGHPSSLATQHNNLFGMTGEGTGGSYKTTGNLDSHPQTFANYNSPQDSFDAYKKTLNNPRYADAMKANNFEDAAKAMQKGGYATDKHYADNLINVHNQMSQMNSIKQATQMAAVPGATPSNVAASYAGLGRQNHPEALEGFFKKSLGQDVNIKNTPWCAAFANSVLQSTGHGSTGSLAAKSFLGYGTPTTTPSQGDVVVLNRANNPNLGHVGFFAGYNEDKSMVKILGGNESGMVTTKEYPVSSVAGYRVPPTAGELQQRSQQEPQQNPTMLASNGPAQPGLLQSTQQPVQNQRMSTQTQPQKPQNPSIQTPGQQTGGRVGQALSRNLVQEAQQTQKKAPKGPRNMNEISWGLLG